LIVIDTDDYKFVIFILCFSKIWFFNFVTVDMILTLIFSYVEGMIHLDSLLCNEYG